MKSLLKSLLTVIQLLAFTLIAAYGFSGIYILFTPDRHGDKQKDEDDKFNAMGFGLMATVILMLVIPIVAFACCVHFESHAWHRSDEYYSEFGANSLPYVLTVVLVWFIGLLIRIFR